MSKKNVDPLISAGGLFCGFFIALFKVVQKLGGSAEDIYAALKEGSSLVDEFASLIVKASKKVKDATLLVNYDRRVEAGVRVGHYDWWATDITDNNFPTTQQGTREVFIRLIHLNKIMSIDQVLIELDRMNLRPANLQEGLAFGERYPDVQREFPIIFLGSVWQNPGGSRCPCLSGGGSGRGLDLSRTDGSWRGICRFAAVSK